MLILSRKINEELLFFKDGKQIARIKVNRIAGKKVHFGIEADSEIIVIRNELENKNNDG